MTRPALSLPFTILAAPNTVRLVAGEEFRFTLTGPALDTWLPTWLPLLDGSRTLDEAIAILQPQHRAEARQLAEQLATERILVAGPVRAAHTTRTCRLVPEGCARLCEALPSSAHGDPLAVLCQDTLDIAAALRFNERQLHAGVPWLWVSCAALSRGYVSPVFLPDAGPCLACLFSHFHRLSPLPELYDELVRHAESGGVLLPSTFPTSALRLLAHLAECKAEWLAQSEPPAALYRLHVLEVATLEISTHVVLIDPQCPACRGRR